MAGGAGAAFARPLGDGSVKIYATGRDDQNRSQIGVIKLQISGSEAQVTEVSPEPIFTLGERGAFDENGVSYPWIVSSGTRDFMYYVGWMPSIITPFQNHAGLAISDRGTDQFFRHSRAPLLDRTNEEPFCTGSSCVIKDGTIWRMYYTCFIRWGQNRSDDLHYYHIKYAESRDGLRWNRTGQVCIDHIYQDEYALGKPSVIKLGDTYHMWFVWRGKKYRIGYASSKDGINWARDDGLSGLLPSGAGWDSDEVSYPHVFQVGEWLYMIYCGNEYGKGGVGLARCPLVEVS